MCRLTPSGVKMTLRVKWASPLPWTSRKRAICPKVCDRVVSD